MRQSSSMCRMAKCPRTASVAHACALVNSSTPKPTLERDVQPLGHLGVNAARADLVGHPQSLGVGPQEQHLVALLEILHVQFVRVHDEDAL